MSSEKFEAALSWLAKDWEIVANQLHELTVRAQLLGGIVIRQALDRHDNNPTADIDVVEAAYDPGNRGERFWHYCMSAAELELEKEWKHSRAAGYSLTRSISGSSYDMTKIADAIDGVRKDLKAEGKYWKPIHMDHLGDVVTVRARELQIEYRRLITDVNVIKDKLDAADIKWDETNLEGKHDVLVFEHLNSLLPASDSMAWSSRSKFTTRFVQSTMLTYSTWLFGLLGSLRKRHDPKKRKPSGKRKRKSELEPVASSSGSSQPELASSSKTVLIQDLPKEAAEYISLEEVARTVVEPDVHTPLMPAEVDLLNLLEHVLRGLSKASEDQEKVFSRTLCDFGGRNNKRLRSRLRKGTLHLSGDFMTDGNELLVEFYNTTKPAPSKHDILTHATTTPQEITGTEIRQENKQKPLFVSGMDFGAVFPVGACTITPENELLNFCFRQTQYNEVTVLRTQRHLETEKIRHFESEEQERALCGSKDRSTKVFVDFAIHWTQSQKELFEFYSSMSMKEMRRQGRRRRQKFYDLIFSVILLMNGLKPHMNVKDLQANYVFAFGMGKFKTVHGLPSMHSELAAYLCKKVS